MRVVSLLPAATETVAALGAGGYLVGVSHECDYPPEVRALPRVTRTRIDSTRASGDIDRAVTEAQRAGTSAIDVRSEEHTSELQSRLHLVCRLLLEKKKSHERDDAIQQSNTANCHESVHDTQRPDGNKIAQQYSCCHTKTTEHQ